MGAMDPLIPALLKTTSSMPAAAIRPEAKISGRRPMRSESQAAGQVTSSATTTTSPTSTVVALVVAFASPWKKVSLKKKNTKLWTPTMPIRISSREAISQRNRG